MRGKASMTVCSALLIVNELLLLPVVKCARITGTRKQTVILGQRNVKFECMENNFRAAFDWCYDVNCNNPVAECPNNSCPGAMNICYCSFPPPGMSGDRKSKILYFGPITLNMTSRPFYCYQKHPIVSNPAKQVVLKVEPEPTDSLSSPSPGPSPQPATSDNPATSVTTLTIAVNCAIAVCVFSIVLLLYYRLRRRRNLGLPSTRAGLMYDKKWEIGKSQLKIINAIGEGYFGSVVKAEVLEKVSGWTGKTVAIKMVHTKHFSEAAKTLADEIQIMKKIPRHQNIIALVGVCLLNGPLWLVMEYADQGNLLNYLRALRPSDTLDSHILNCCVSSDEERVLKEKTIWKFALQITRGLVHLLEHKCIHRDLAARNVLVCNGQLLKICDFGMAKDVHYTDYYRRTTPGIVPLKWTAPEAAVDKLYTEKSDVWSFGIVLWEIATLGASPYPGIEVHSLLQLLNKDFYRMSCPGLCPQSLYSLMIRCWDAEPDNRPTFRAILEEICTRTED